MLVPSRTDPQRKKEAKDDILVTECNTTVLLIADVFGHILPHLLFEEVCSLATVCKEWAELCSNDNFWMGKRPLEAF